MISREKLVEDLNQGYVNLRVDLYKESGKYAHEDMVRVPLKELEEARFAPRAAFLGLLDRHQNFVVEGALPRYTVVVTEHHYEDVAEYHHFFTRLYHPAD